VTALCSEVVFQVGAADGVLMSRLLGMPLCIQIRNCEYNMEVGGVPRANIISLCGDSDSSYMSPVQSE
jgi:hypothetical protein